jgi:hypothetical protein
MTVSFLLSPEQEQLKAPRGVLPGNGCGIWPRPRGPSPTR